MNLLLCLFCIIPFNKYKCHSAILLAGLKFEVTPSIQRKMEKQKNAEKNLNYNLQISSTKYIFHGYTSYDWMSGALMTDWEAHANICMQPISTMSPTCYTSLAIQWFEFSAKTARPHYQLITNLLFPDNCVHSNSSASLVLRADLLHVVPSFCDSVYILINM